MNNDKKDSIEIVLELLRKTLIKNHMSIGFNRDKKSLVFFDTDTYLKDKKFDGFEVNIETLVR
jgi:hypothetical protein